MEKVLRELELCVRYSSMQHPLVIENFQAKSVGRMYATSQVALAPKRVAVSYRFPDIIPNVHGCPIFSLGNGRFITLRIRKRRRVVTCRGAV